MAINNPNQINIEPGDNRTSEEKIKDFADKVRPYLKLLWQARRKFLIFNSSVLIVSVVYLFFIAKPYYESSVVILPEYGSKSTSLGQLSDLAAMAGVKVGEGTPTEIYQNLLKSETVIEPVIYQKYKTDEYADSVNLIEYFDVEKDNSLSQDLQKRKMFVTIYNNLTRNRISVDVDKQSKILTVSVTMPEAKLSADVANRMVESLDNYIRTKRKSYAGEQRYYLDMRVGQVKDSLAIVENSLMNFREKNRMTLQSPVLMLEQGRLTRNVEILQTVFIELTKQLELAKIDEIKNTPIVNIRENAREPILKSGPKRLYALIIILFFSLALSSLYILFKDNIVNIYRIIKGEGSASKIENAQVKRKLT